MSGKPKYKIGSKYGMLTIISDSGKRQKGSGNVIWICECECGKHVERSSESLHNSKRLGCISSCGCYVDPMQKACGKRLAQNNIRLSRMKDALGCIDGTTMQGIKRMNLNKNNRSGYRGVSILKDGRYRAGLQLRGYCYSKEFTTLEEAIAQRQKWEKLYIDPIIKDYEEEHGTYRGKKPRKKGFN